MPKGKHKGGRRHFTDFEATEQEKLKKEKEKQWRKNRGESDSDEESGSEKSSEESEEESESSEEEEEEVQAKPKGPSGIIETANLNRQVQKTKKVTDISFDSSSNSSKPQLSRKEREEVEKQKAAAHYRKLHAAGKTDEARADLERLSLIRQQREEAAKRKEEDKKARENAASAKKDQVAKALNKKSKS